MRLVGYALILVAVVLTAWQVVWLGPDLPDTVASHFDRNGQPDGFMSRFSFLAIHVGLQVFTIGMMLGCAMGMRWIPDSLLNIPNKDYWLHEDRRANTLAVNSALLVFVAGLTGVFVSGLFQLSYVANVEDGGQLRMGAVGGAVGILLGGFLFLILGVVVFTYWRFRLPKDGLAD